MPATATDVTDNRSAAPAAVPTRSQSTPRVPVSILSPGAESEKTEARREGPIVLVAAASPTAAPGREETPVPVPSRAVRLELPSGEIVSVGRSRPIPVGPGIVQWDVPRDVAGQHADTPGCGQAGQTVIVGHSVWYSERGVFASLLETTPGQIIRCVNDDGRVYQYQITSTREVSYEDGSWLSEVSTKDLLTLYTCKADLTALVVVQAEQMNELE